MMAQIETEVIPVWFIERWLKENAEEGSALDHFIKQMLQEWKVEDYKRNLESRKYLRTAGGR